MRVLDTKTGQFVEIDPEATDEYGGRKTPVYAILSHTWDKKGEQTYEQLKKIQLRYASPSQTPQGPSDVREASPSEQDPDGPPSTMTLPSAQPMLEAWWTWMTERQREPDSGTPSSPKDDKGGASPVPPPSQHPSNYPSGMMPSPTGFGRLTQSEVDSLLRAVAETYHLTNPTPLPASKSIWDDPELSPKIRDACRIARENGYRYIWIDSCCIDKSSSSELSEAINSMYKWYGLAAVCYAYLADVPPGTDHQAKGSAFRKSRWFRRGWTLQELIAPFSVQFLSEEWAPIGSKRELVDLVESVTKIDERALLRVEPLDMFSVAQRLSWAAYRETTREEDQAYSLLGMFDINMPTLYGEGNRAFRRLQEQIMQRTPDQSLFAWGGIYPSSQLSHDPDLTDTQKAYHAILQTRDWRRDLFATSPNFFDGCEGVRTARREAGLLVSSNGHKIAYTPTPYGISTQFLMIPLTQDLLLHAIPNSAKDLKFYTSNSPRGSQRYLAILQCELRERQGHCLGRVCYLTPSEESDVNFLYTGLIHLYSQPVEKLGYPDLFLLSPETIEHFSPQTELKTVYIPHPDRATLPTSSSLREQPYTTIKLVLSRATRDALRVRGYSADLRAPDPDHPTTHWLTLSKAEHTITVEFQHNLTGDGKWFTIEAKVRMSGSRVQLHSAPDSDQADCHTVSLSENCFWRKWKTELDHKKVRLSAAGDRMLTVDLGLEFAGGGYYFLHVDVLSDAPPASSAVELAVDQEKEGEGTREGSPSGAIDNEDAGPGDPEETGGGETAPSAGDRDVVTTSDNMEGRDGDHGVSA
ncbi:hypothetical protein V8D89_001204 [Ganoderma adspersum]